MVYTPPYIVLVTTAEGSLYKNEFRNVYDDKQTVYSAQLPLLLTPTTYHRLPNTADTAGGGTLKSGFNKESK